MSKSAPKSKNIQNNLLKNIVSVFTANPFKQFNYKQISSALNIHDKSSRMLVVSFIHELLRDQVLTEQQKGKFKLNPGHIDERFAKECYMTGTIDMKNTGKAFLIPEDGSEDVIIASTNTANALPGDKVKVFLFPARKEKQPEGQVVEVISRAKKQWVGVIQKSKTFAFLVPDRRNMPVDIFIPNNKLKGAKDGQKVVAIITEWDEHSKNPLGEVVSVLGNPGDNNVEMNSILADFDFPLDFSDKVKKEAEQISEVIDNKELNNREDFRDVFTMTIDPQDAKDFDDALSLKILSNGNYEVGVHIADVSHYVKPGSALDEEAYSRGTSVYLVDRVIPMLPERISNQICSLSAHDDKLCFSAIFELTPEAKLLKQRFKKTLIHSNKRFNYEEAQQIIETGLGEFASEVLILDSLAKKLRQERFKAGSINFETTEVKFRLDEKGKPIGVYIKESKDSNKLIEEFMLLANRKVAEFVGKPKGNAPVKTFVYRIHDEPTPEKVNTFTEFVKKFGYKMNLKNKKQIAESFNSLLDETSGKAEQNIIEQMAIRTMQKAYYSTSNVGHYGLAFDYYSHFTSPIRRYPDLMVHRLLWAYLESGKSANQKEYEEKCKASSEMEKKATDAERASIKYKQVEYLMEKLGEAFEGVISGVSKWGIYVEIKENKCEGMVSFRNMTDDFYYLDEDNHQAIGHRKGKKYQLGDTVKIRIAKVSLEKKQIDFEFID